MAKEQTTQSGGILLSKGDRIGKYEVSERIGVGGQAIIYKCYDPLLDRYVAAKQISSNLAADPKFVERFRKEAQILAKLGGEQPAIVTIHELIQDERGLFIVMEYLPGHSLETVLEETKGPVEPKATLQIIWRLAAALHAVHSAGVIHRDLKPSNIIVGEGLRAKITDFGVAASISGQTSMRLGTTKYMAPELFEGGSVDGRADMYSLGFIAYEMLAGRAKFNEIFAEVVRDKHSEALRWMKWHGNLSVEAPALHEINPAVPQPLSDVVAKMMAKDRDLRYENMEALGRAIKSTFSPRARPPSRPSRRRRRMPAPEPVAAGAAAAGAAAPVSPSPLSAEAQESVLVPSDEGDELVVRPEGATTAPIPSAGVGRKVLVFFVLPLAAILALGGAIGGGIYLWQQRSRSQQRARTAESLYVQASSTYVAALKDYDTAKFKAARDDFARMQKEFPNAPDTARASVWELVCDAYVAVAEDDWSRARDQEVRAEEVIEDIQRTRSDLEDWTRKARQHTASLHSYYLSTRTFREAMAKAETAYEGLQFDEARKLLRRELRGVRPTPAQEKQLAAFHRRVDLKEFQTALQTQIKEARSLRDQNKFAEAEAAYQKARELLKSKKADIMAGAERDKIGKTLNKELVDLSSQRTLRNAYDQVTAARSSGDKKALLAALEELDRVEPKPDPKDAEAVKKAADRKKEIVNLKAELALEDGRKLVAAGKIPQARQAFERAKQFTDTPAAKAAEQELKKLDLADQRLKLVTAGNRHFAGARWAEALAQYQQAAKIAMDDSLAAKIVECSFRIELAKADMLRAEKKYDEAIKAYEVARSKKRAASGLIDARLEAMAADRLYEAHMTDGRAALKREQHPKALEYFRKAKAIRETEEVKDAIAETRYRENLARGREAMEQDDYNGALGYFKVAKGFKDTKEIQELIAEAERKKQGG